MFAVNFGSANREAKILELANSDHTTAVILASVHFEWMIKRTILKIGCRPTTALRTEFEKVYSLNPKKGNDYSAMWNREVAVRFRNSTLDDILGDLAVLYHRAIRVRGRVIHGNGTVSKKVGMEAVERFLDAGRKLRNFAQKHGVDVDARLAPRRVSRKSK